MATATIHEKFLDGLGDIYDAENRFLKAQEEMLSKATAEPVRALLEKHIEETRGHIENVEKAFESLGEPVKKVQCQASAGLVAEGQRELKDSDGNPALLDYVIAGAAGKVEHYEIVSYQGLIREAEAMGHKKALGFLQKNLKQEEATAQKIEKAEPKLLEAAMAPDERDMGDKARER